MNAKIFKVSKPYPSGPFDDAASEAFCRELAHALGEELFNSDCSALIQQGYIVSLSVKVVVPEAVQEAELEAAPRIVLPN